MGADCGFKLNYFKLSTLLKPHDQILLSSSENAPQKSFYAIDKIISGYYLRISTEKTKWIAFCGKHPIIENIVLNNCVTEQVKNLLIT